MYKKEVLKQEINLRKEYRIGSDLLCDLALSCKGTVYGGYVRDKIIEEYYTKLYFNNSEDKKILEDNYWEPEYDICNKKRILLPKDIDIHFIFESDYDNFIKKVVKKFDMITLYLDTVNKKSSTLTKKVRVMYEVGKKLSEDGDCLFFELDVKITNKSEAPFNSLDFYTNSLLMKKNKGNINVSKNTGIINDCHGHFNYVILNDIINMLYRGETKLVKKITNETDAKKILIKTVEMIYDDWKISNFDKIIKCENCEENCVICLENNPNLRIMNCSYVHDICLKKHIKSTMIHKENNSFYIMGPQREKINI